MTVHFGTSATNGGDPEKVLRRRSPGRGAWQCRTATALAWRRTPPQDPVTNRVEPVVFNRDGTRDTSALRPIHPHHRGHVVVCGAEMHVLEPIPSAGTSRWQPPATVPQRPRRRTATSGFTGVLHVRRLRLRRPDDGTPGPVERPDGLRERHQVLKAAAAT